MRVYVSSRGAVVLGDDVTCDGFVRSHRVRVQTHVHRDHMDQFDTSKGNQDVLVSLATRDLLIQERNADLPYRSNIKVCESGVSLQVGESEVTLLDSGHMLGAVQVQVTLSDGTRCGYSGDFSWPLDNVIQVDELVLDSTYGSPDRVRQYSQEDANDRFIDLVRERIRYGPIRLGSHKGTLHRALGCLNGVIDSPIVVDPKLEKELAVYRRHGYCLPDTLASNTPEGIEACKNLRHIRASADRDLWKYGTGDCTTIELSAYWTQPDNPVLEFSERAYRVALSDHADYPAVIEYVRASGAKRVMTDNTRGGHAIELAQELKRRLNIEAVASFSEFSREWGS